MLSMRMCDPLYDNRGRAAVPANWSATTDHQLPMISPKTMKLAILLVSLYLIEASEADLKSHLNDTCIDLKFEELHQKFNEKFKSVAETPILNFARVLGQHTDEASGETTFDVSVRWTKADVANARTRKYARTFSLVEFDHELVNSYEGALTVMDNVQLMDFHRETGASAQLSVNEYGEQYLTVNTSNAQTSCTLRLNMYSNIHGKVLTDDTFGTFKFSPDGKYLLYTAESPNNPMSKYLYLGTFGESPKAARPIVVLYDIENLSFQGLETIPQFYSAGELSWKHDSSGIIGLVWWNHPFPMGCPSCANRKSQVFAADLFKTSSLVEDHFVLLTPEDRHAASPRLTNDGLSIVYFENELSTADRYLVPGPQDKSRQLKRFVLAEAEMESKKAAQSGQLGIDASELVIDDVQEAVTMHDGTTFYGLYPKFPLPDRCFSNDHVMYLTIYQAGSLRAIAVDLNTKQLTIHPEPDVIIMDVTDDLVLVQKNSLNFPSRLAAAFVAFHAQTSTTTTTTIPTTTITTSTTTTTTTPLTTTTDPCDDMLQQLELDNGETHSTTMGTPTTAVMTTPTTTEPTTTTTTTTTTIHPHTYPLPWAFAQFHPFTQEFNKEILIEDYILEGRNVRRWSQAHQKGEYFNAIFAAPPHLDHADKMPLVVFIHDGPHEQFSRGFDIKANTFLALDMAVLLVNYRGSTGMGDNSLESVISNIGLFDVNDVEQAINYTLTNNTQLDETRIALLGEGYGATIAVQLSLKRKSRFNVTVLVNPIADIGAMSSSVDLAEWPYHVMGVNYSSASVPTEILSSAWEKSPLNKVNQIKAATLIFVGTEDKRVLPEAQGIPFYKALRSQMSAPTSLYHYPGEGHVLHGLETNNHLLVKAVAWMHKYWGSYDDICTFPGFTSTTTTTKYPSSSTKRPPNTTSGAASDYDYFKAAIGLIAMQLFTLSVWCQLKLQ